MGAELEAREAEYEARVAEYEANQAEYTRLLARNQDIKRQIKAKEERARKKRVARGFWY